MQIKEVRIPETARKGVQRSGLTVTKKVATGTGGGT
jgi:hypothetical protein